MLLAVFGVALIHGRVTKKLSGSKLIELFLVYLLVIYCGLMMGIGSIWDLFSSLNGTSIYPFPAGGPYQQFFGLSLLGMSLIAISTIWFRGKYLIAPTIGWSIFWFGATYIHLTTQDHHTTSSTLGIIASHGLVGLILLGLLVSSAKKNWI